MQPISQLPLAVELPTCTPRIGAVQNAGFRIQELSVAPVSAVASRWLLEPPKLRGTRKFPNRVLMAPSWAAAQVFQTERNTFKNLLTAIKRGRRMKYDPGVTGSCLGLSCWSDTPQDLALVPTFPQSTH